MNKEQAAEYYRTHRAEKIAYALKYQRENKARKLIWGNNERRRVRTKLLALLGGSCFECGTNKRIEIDHRQAGGNMDRITRGSNWQMYRYYLKHPDEAKEKLQLLCKSHNLRKEHINHERWPSKHLIPNQ
jgi:RNase P subunit RPR2